MSVIKKVASNYIFQMFGKGASLLIGLAIIALLSRYLKEDEWGAYITATSFLSFFGVFVDFGLTLTLTQMISSPQADEKKIIGNVLGIRLISGTIFYTISILIVFLLPYSDLAKAAVVAGVGAFFFMSAAGSLIGVFQKHLALRRYVIAELTSRGVYLVLTFLCVVLHLGLLPLLGVMGVANGLWLILVIIAAKPLVAITPKIDWPVWHEAFRRSAPIAISTIFNLMYLRGDVLILAWIRPDEVAQYGTAYKVVDVMTAFPTMLMGLLLPQLALAWQEKNHETFKKILQKAVEIFSLVAAPLFFGAQIVSVQLTTLIASQKYETAGVVLKILILAIVCVFINTLYGHVIVAIHKQKIMVWGYAFTALISLIGYIILIPKFGMWGAAWVTCFSELTIALLTFAVVSWFTKTLPNIKIPAKALLASIIMYLVLTVLPINLPVLITIGIGAAVYALTILGLGGVKLNFFRTITTK